MIDAESVKEIIAIYSKHGWLLRRVLLSTKSKNDLSGLFAGIEIRDSAIDAAWFSRPPRNGGVAWELRYLGNTPFALFEMADENAADFEQVLAAVVERLRLAIAAKESLDNRLA